MHQAVIWQVGVEHCIYLHVLLKTPWCILYPPVVPFTVKVQSSFNKTVQEVVETGGFGVFKIKSPYMQTIIECSPYRGKTLL